MNKVKKFLCKIVVLSMCFTLMGNSMAVSAKVKMNAKKVTLIKGKSTKLKISGTKKKIKWSSSNKKVATVNAKGTVKAKKVGKTIVKAKVGKKTYKCTVYVKKVQSTAPKGTKVKDSDGEEGWGPLIPFN